MQKKKNTTESEKKYTKKNTKRVKKITIESTLHSTLNFFFLKNLYRRGVKKKHYREHTAQYSLSGSVESTFCF
jgi:hypothetical protein